MTTPVRNDEQSRVQVDGRRTFVPVLLRLAYGSKTGIRVNVVNPDAVLRGSRIWEGEWRAQRAGAYNVAPDALDEVYRQRSMLKLNVFPEDIAEAVYFFASDLSAKSTGNILNVDAGHAPAFTR